MLERTPGLWLKCGVFFGFARLIGLKWLTGWPAVYHEGLLSAISRHLRNATFDSQLPFSIASPMPAHARQPVADHRRSLGRLNRGAEGHTSANMIRQHYGIWINEDGPDVIGMLQNALDL